MSFRWKTILGIALIELFFLVMLVWQASHFIQRLGETDIEKRAQDTTFLAGSVMLDSLISYDLAALEEHVHQIGALDGIRYVSVDGYGKTLAEYFNNGVGAMAPEPDATAVTDGVYDVRHELKAGGETFGVLKVGFSVEELYALTNQAQARLYAIAIAEVLLVALCSWLFARYLTRRILVLRDASVRLQQGQFSAPIVLNGNDEVAETIQAFNSMSKELLEREEALRELNKELTSLNDELVERENDVQSLLTLAPDGIATLDESGKVVFANKALGELLEIDERTLVGQTIFGFLGESTALTHIAEPVEGESQPRRMITTLLSRSGRELCVEINASSFQSVRQGLSILIIRDKTHEHELERAANVSEQLKANLIDTSLDALITINQDGLVTDFSPSAESLFGWRHEEIVGKPMSDYVIPEDMRAAHEKGMQHFLATGEGPLLGNRIETQALRKSGRCFPVELALTATKVADDIYITAAIRDISERKEKEQELIDSKAEAEEASTAKSRFLSYMSHEIRSPLNAVLGSLTLIQKQVNLGEEGSRYVRLAQDSGEALLQVVNEVLDFSKIEAGHIEFKRVSFCLPDLIDGVQASIQAKGVKSGVAIHAEVSDNLKSLIKADRDHLRQVLTILMDNAYKFTEAGEISVHASDVTTTEGASQDRCLRIEVRDTGTGIPEHLVETIFSEFEQVDATRDTGFGGTGLGLAIARKLIEGMNGRIWVKSKVGVGTTFYAEIPYEIRSEEACADNLNTGVPADNSLPEPDDKTESSAEKTCEVLLVDDVYANQVIGTELLKGKGYRVDVAKDGVEAVEKASTKAYSAILMDMRMPRLNGLEATELIRSSGGLNAKTPIIALSANAEKSEIERCYKVGMNDFVSKPFKIEQLTATIERCLQNPQLEEDPMTEMETKYAEFEIMSAAVLKQLAKDTSEEAVPMMLSVFINEIKKRAGGIVQAHDSKDEDEIREQAHAMKSCAGTFGGERLQAAAKDLEHLASESRACENPALIHLVGKVADETLLAYSEYHKLLESMSARTD
ncbi:PAS domain S-box protein [Methylophaga sp.]|uniref:PAS domain S-box protein n=1 Tax=Methylophaga sp. TaxID=2024840 RepID=UPI003A90FD77